MSQAAAPHHPTSNELAAERTYLAHERTLMAWVRTAVSLISFGFTIYKFFQFMQDQNPERAAARLFGPREFAGIMIGIGLFALLMSTIQSIEGRKKIRRIYGTAPLSYATILAGLISVLGILAFLAVIFRH